jgi:hypothetical protein
MKNKKKFSFMGLLRFSVKKMVSGQYDFVLIDQFFRNFITKGLLAQH